MKPYAAALACVLIYFTAAFLTLSDYGISWDETLHFRRGQAYLYYFLTGQLDYHLLPNINLQRTNGDPQKIPLPRRSLYQNDLHNGKFMLESDSGHPPLSDEMAALSNYIFFQKLGVLDDVSAHHLFNITASSLLVLVVVWLAADSLGIFAGLVSFLALVTYPLFFSESHFNIKDPPEAAFFAATIWAFLQSLKNKSTVWLILSWVFLGFALGTKFNILFIPLIVIPYLVLRYRGNLSLKILSFPRPYLIFLALGSLITVVIFVGTWPYLWQVWPANLQSIFAYYKEIGTGFRYQPDNFFVAGFNIFPLLWILFTTPPLVLVLFASGVAAVISGAGKKVPSVYLWLLWFIVPLLRVMWPGAVIYGGIRQVMEFLPALALLAGLGAWQIRRWFKGRIFSNAVPVLLVVLFAWPIFILFRMHPNENVYFNSLIGGLPGAAERNFPSWGNSFGNVYRQGVNWLNSNAESGAKLSLIQGTTANVPIIWLRPDINYQNSNFSGIDRKGEYLMELTFNDSSRDYYYAWEYTEGFLEPVYSVKVAGVPILKIWKNDLEHTKPDMQRQEVSYGGKTRVFVDTKTVKLSFDSPVNLSRVEMEFGFPAECVPSLNGFVETSMGDGKWVKEKDQFPFAQVGRQDNIQKRKITFFFAGRQTKEVRLVFNSKVLCTPAVSNVNVVVLR